MPLAMPILILATTVAAEIVVLSSGEGIVRALIVGVFLGLAPGAAILRLVRLPLEPVLWIGLAVTVSLSVDTVLAGGLLYLGAWSAELATTTLALLVVLLTVVDLPITRRGARGVARVVVPPERAG